MSTCRIVRVPGPQGFPGEDGIDGIDGIDAFTTLTAPFTMPAELGSAVASVVNSVGFVVKQVVGLQFMGIASPNNFGYFEVTALPSPTSLTLKNLRTGTAYATNAAPGTIAPIGSKLTPGGLQGPPGQDGTTGAPEDGAYVVQSANALLPSAQSLGALTTGLLKNTVAGTTGTLSTGVDGTDYLSPATGLIPASIGVSVQAYDLDLTAIAALISAANKVPYATGAGTWALTDFTAFGRTLAGAADVAAARVALGVLGGYGLLGSLTAVDLNIPNNDAAITIGAFRYQVDKVVVDNPSVSLTTATAGLFTAAGGGGTTLAADQSLAALSASTKLLDLTLQAVTDTDVFTSGTLYFRVGTAQGVAATANVKIFGWVM